MNVPDKIPFGADLTQNNQESFLYSVIKDQRRDQIFCSVWRYWTKPHSVAFGGINLRKCQCLEATFSR